MVDKEEGLRRKEHSRKRRVLDRPITILLVEDNPGDVRLIERMLAKTKGRYRLEHAPSLSAGIASLETGGIDVVLLDLSLPDSEGLDTFLRVQVRAPDVPVVVLSGLEDNEVALQAVQAGAQDYLVKRGPLGEVLAPTLTYAIERKRTEAELIRNQIHLAQAQQIAHIGSWEWDVRRGEVSWSDELYRILGIAPGAQEATLAGLLEHVHPDDRDGTRHAIERALADRSALCCRLRIVRGHGAVRRAELHGEAQIDRDGNPRRLFGTLQDVTERVQLEEAVREKEIFHRIFANGSEPGAIHRFPDGAYLDVNQEFVAAIGFSREEVLGRTPAELGMWADPAEREVLNAELRAHGSYRNREVHIRIRDGRVRTFVLSATVIEVAGESHAVAFARDVTEERVAEQRLRESEERFRSMADTAPVMIWISGTDKLCTYFNRRWLEFTGRSMEQELGNGYAEGVHPDDLERCLETYSTAFDARRDFEMEYRLRRFDGEYRWIVDGGTPLYTPDGTFTGFIGSAIDITERRRAQDEILRLATDLKHRVAELQTLLDVLPVGVAFALDRECTQIRANPYLTKLLGVPAGANVSLSAPEAERPRFRILRDGVELHGDELPLQSAALRGISIPDTQIDVAHPGGSVVNLLGSAAPLFDEQGKVRGAVCAFLDVTHHKRLETQLRNSQKMEAMGLLAAGVAHEINNPLTFVLSHLEALAEALPRLANGHSRSLDAIHTLISGTRDALEGAERVRQIVSDLKTFSRIEVERTTPVRIKQVAEKAAKMAASEIRQRARLVRDLQDVPAVIGNEGRLLQVLLNLLINAAQAIDETDAGRHEVRLRTWSEADEVLVEVADTGKGISPEHLEKLFDPFFTTKANGTGLGLSICDNIIASYGGRIEVESTPGRGAKFLLRLPAAAAELVVASPTTTPLAVERSARRGRILVIDDEALIRATAKLVLGRQHDLVTASSGREAISILEHDGAFDLILCDLLMPEVSGIDVYHDLAERNPGLLPRLVFMTGAVASARARDFLGGVTNRCVEKPFNTRELLGVVQERIAVP